MLDLLDYRRRMTEMFRDVRQATDHAVACRHFRNLKNEMFRTHPQTALTKAQREAFAGLRYYDYDAAYRVVAPLDRDVAPDVFYTDLGEDGDFHYRRVGRVTFTLPTGTGTLNLYWILGYGGGIFLPFRDASSGDTTYGGGRYLYDTIKGADLGTDDERMVLDFNYAYNPSCAYNPRWVCPLAPPENHLDFPVPVGEQAI